MVNKGAVKADPPLNKGKRPTADNLGQPMVKKEGEIKEHPSTGSQARPENDARTQ